MEVEVATSSVAGRTRAPPSKSYTHRALLAAGYADGPTVVGHPLASADTRATGAAVEAFGGTVTWTEEGARVAGFGGVPSVPPDVVDCANSGTTMRLAIATGALVEGFAVFTGDSSLRSRPQAPLLAAVEDLGGTAFSTRGNGRAPVVVGGPFDGGAVEIPGDVSSQFVTALLLAGAVTEEGIEVELTTRLKSAPYVDITLQVLSAFGVAAEETADGYAVAGDQRYAAPTGGYRVPGDFSSASYLLAAGAMAGDPGLRVTGLSPGPQGDRAIVQVLRRMGADLTWNRDEGWIEVASAHLRGVEVDVGDTPDLLPTIAVLGAAAGGTTRITNCEHVRYKETDRVAAMAAELERLGAVVAEREDELLIDGDESTLEGARVDGRGDHRLVMALAVAGLVASGATTVAGAEHVDVSFPGFFDVLSDLGATVTVEP